MFKDTTFLYVEDDPKSQDALRLVLSRIMGAEHVYIFSDSSNFMQRVRQLSHKPDLFLIDIQVAPHDGFEMLKMLRADENYEDSKIVALTASVMDEEVNLLKQSGFNGMCGKPIQVAAFPSLIRRILGGEDVWTVTSL